MIDEKKLIESFRASLNTGRECFPVDLIIETIEEQTKVGVWIPCSVEMPPKPEENPLFDNKSLELYLVSVDGDAYPFRAFWNGKFFTDGWTRLNAIAWMPLPEPYRPCTNTDCVYNSGKECPASEGCAGYQLNGE